MTREVAIADEPEHPEVRLNEIAGHLQIEYPCRWVYKVIGRDPQAIRRAVMELIEIDGVTLESSHRSSGGKYVSINVAVTVRNERERTGIYEALKRHRDVRLVL